MVLSIVFMYGAMAFASIWVALIMYWAGLGK